MAESLESFTYPFVLGLALLPEALEEFDTLRNLRGIHAPLWASKQTKQNVAICAKASVSFALVCDKMLILLEGSKHRFDVHVSSKDAQCCQHIRCVVCIGKTRWC
jgi:hypothetical protein